jgi:hypothetical protein
MAILIANIGTSDLVIKIEGFDYFLPILFRKEPNLEGKLKELTPEEKGIWDDRNNYVKAFLCDHLGVETSRNQNEELVFSFREFSQKLLGKYNEYPEYWYDRIRPGRIWGVIRDSISLSNLDKIIFIATDQDPPNNDKDTLYLCQILEQWLPRKYTELQEINLQTQIIPKHISAIDQDGLMHYFYQLISSLDPEELILVSVKGGTPQMQQSLQAQAISSGLTRLVFIDPQLSVPDMLRGNSSQCKLTSYWRYTHTQKLLTIKMLLNRWDFDGAKEVCDQWRKTVENLKQLGIQDVSEYAIDLDTSTKALELGVAFLNLDYERAKNLIRDNRQQFDTISNLENGYNTLLNIYTQCRICVDLSEVSNFLVKASSFYEGLLFTLIDKKGKRYFDRSRYPDSLIMNPKSLTKQLQDCFLAERDPKKGNKLTSRFDKRDFLACLVTCEANEKEKEIYSKIFSNLQSLDYWVDLRNRIIHLGQGFSWETMRRSLEEDRKNNEDFSTEACRPDDILACLSRTYNLMTDFLRQPRNPYVGIDRPYYLYSDIRLWIERKWEMNTSTK